MAPQVCRGRDAHRWSPGFGLALGYEDALVRDMECGWVAGGCSQPGALCVLLHMWSSVGLQGIGAVSSCPRDCICLSTAGFSSQSSC